MEIRLAKPASRAGAGAWLGLAWQKKSLMKYFKDSNSKNVIQVEYNCHNVYLKQCYTSRLMKFMPMFVRILLLVTNNWRGIKFNNRNLMN